MKDQCLTSSGYSEKDDNKPIEYIQTSSFIETSHGDLKRRRQKLAYSDIKLERHNYIKEIVRLSDKKKNEGSICIDTKNSEKPSRINNTHYTTFKRKVRIDINNPSNDGSKGDNRKFNSQSSKTSINSKKSCLKSSKMMNQSNSHINKQLNQKSSDTHQGYNQLLEKDEFNKKQGYNSLSTFSRNQSNNNNNNSNNTNTNTKAKTNNIISSANELQQLQSIKNEIESIIQSKVKDKMLVKELTSFEGKSDCIYMPDDFEKEGNMGYAFINFTHSNQMARSVVLKRTNQNGEEEGNYFQSCRSFSNGKNILNLKKYLTKPVYACDSDICNDNVKGKGRMKGLIKNTQIKQNQDNMDENQRYTQNINRCDSIEDIHDQINKQHEKSKSNVPVLNAKKRHINTIDNHEKIINPCYDEKVNEDNIYINDDNKYSLHDNGPNTLHSKTVTKNIKSNMNRGNNDYRAITDNNSQISEEVNIESIGNKHFSKYNTSGNAKTINSYDKNYKISHECENLNDLEKDKFIDSKGNRYNLSDIYKIIERTHQMTLKSTTRTLTETFNDPFNKIDYDKLILFLKKYERRHKQTLNSKAKMNGNILSSIQQSNQSKNSFKRKLLMIIDQLKSEMVHSNNSFIQNRISTDRHFSPLTLYQLNPYPLPLTSRCRTIDKQIKENISKERKLNYNNPLSSSNQFKQLKPKECNNEFLSLSKIKSSRILNSSNRYLNRVKQDVFNYPIEKYIIGSELLTAKTVGNSHNDNNYQPRYYNKKHKKNKELIGLMPANNLDLNYF